MRPADINVQVNLEIAGHCTRCQHRPLALVLAPEEGLVAQCGHCEQRHAVEPVDGTDPLEVLAFLVEVLNRLYETTTALIPPWDLALRPLDGDREVTG